MPGASDVATHVAGLAYSYTHGPHTLGVEADYIDRDASIVGDTESYRVGMFWRVAFDKPAVRRSPSGAASPAPAAVPAPTGSLALAGLVPGMSVAAATRRIDVAGAGEGRRIADALVWELSPLANLFRRQRLALVQRDGRVDVVAVIIDLDLTFDAARAAESYSRALEEMIRRYGPPGRVFDEGRFSADYIAAINEGRLILVAEWKLDGGTLRLGLLRRLDRVVRIEVQYRRNFPPPSDIRWSLEELR